MVYENINIYYSGVGTISVQLENRKLGIDFPLAWWLFGGVRGGGGGWNAPWGWVVIVGKILTNFIVVSHVHNDMRTYEIHIDINNYGIIFENIPHCKLLHYTCLCYSAKIITGSHVLTLTDFPALERLRSSPVVARGQRAGYQYSISMTNFHRSCYTCNNLEWDVKAHLTSAAYMLDSDGW